MVYDVSVPEETRSIMLEKLESHEQLLHLSVQTYGEDYKFKYLAFKQGLGIEFTPI